MIIGLFGIAGVIALALAVTLLPYGQSPTDDD